MFAQLERDQAQLNEHLHIEEISMKRKDDRTMRLKTAADYTQATCLCPVS